MAKAVFLTFQTQFNLDFLSASRSGTLGFANTQSFSSLKMSLQYCTYYGTQLRI
jgi:hypothetical protein